MTTEHTCKSARTVEARFLAKITKNVGPKGCWIFDGAVSGGNGYGSMRDETGRMDYAHRISHRLYKGPIPDGALVLHTCDCRKCANPEHIYSGTHAQNIKDAIERERYARRGKLRAAQVLEIVAKSKAGASRSSLSERFHVSPESIARILQGKTYSKLTGIKPKSKTKSASKSKRKSRATH